MKENNYLIYLPKHVVPFPWYPRLHEQLWEPSVFLHTALMSQIWVLVAHSSTSKGKRKCNILSNKYATFKERACEADKNFRNLTSLLALSLNYPYLLKVRSQYVQIDQKWRHGECFVFKHRMDAHSTRNCIKKRLHFLKTYKLSGIANLWIKSDWPMPRVSVVWAFQPDLGHSFL